MEPLRELSIELTQWLQVNYPQLEEFFKLQSGIGRFEFYLVFILLVYWCLDKSLGRSIAYLLTFSYLINSILKHAFRDPRPYWLEAALGLDTEESYGVPSGHAQAATVFFGILGLWFKKAWVWILAIIMILLISISRIYLGVHDLEDIIAGIVIGIGILAGYFFWQKYLAHRYANQILGKRLLIALLVPLSLVAVYLIVMIIVGQPDTNVAWSTYISEAEQTSIENVATSFGAVLGFGIGFVLEVSRVRFLSSGSIGKRALRFIVGLLTTLILWLGLELIIPSEPLALSIPLRIIHLFVVTLWIAYYAPWIFVRLGLADSKPEPEVSITI
jgi:membrane-associated phospholipid phosphatase